MSTLYLCRNQHHKRDVWDSKGFQIFCRVSGNADTLSICPLCSSIAYLMESAQSVLVLHPLWFLLRSGQSLKTYLKEKKQDVRDGGKINSNLRHLLDDFQLFLTGHPVEKVKVPKTIRSGQTIPIFYNILERQPRVTHPV
jgi:hypothetical protein